MFQNISQTFTQYMNFYQKYAADCWRDMQPMEYGALLLGIGLFGWFLMKNASHR